jgi:hypothetical protein
MDKLNKMSLPSLTDSFLNKHRRAKGYKKCNRNYFVTFNSQQYSKNSTYTTPTQTYGTASVYGNTAYGSSTAYGGQTYNISKPRASHTIACFKEKPKGFSYNAKFLQKSMKAKYGIINPVIKQQMN